MRNRLLLIVPLLAVAAIASWAALRATRPVAEWTTESPEALAALQQGLEAERKLYMEEARRHFARAAELDPTFVVAQLGLLRLTPARPTDETAMTARKERVRRLAATDRSRLTPREAFLLDYHVTMADGDRGDALQRLQLYLDEHPRDPYVLEILSEHLWAQQRFAEAERTYEKLLAIEPNWVRAQNNLGYIAMAQGQFAAAEDRFRTYRYVAPDQANPHDSLGELLLLTGRWEDARRELEQALAVRRDFCASYVHLTYLAMLTGRAGDAAALFDRADRDGGCEGRWLSPQRCRIELWERAQDQEWQALAEFDASCAADERVWPWMPHLAALQLGDLTAARQIEVAVASWMQPDPVRKENRALLAHLEGMRLVAEGHARAGAERLEAADGDLGYFGVQLGLFKLYNRLQWSDALHHAGEVTAAERKLQEVAAVNPTIAESFRDGEMGRLRLVAREIPSGI